MFGPVTHGSAICHCEDGRWVVFLGELYNHDDLRSTLAIHDDTTLARLLFIAFERWMDDCIVRLDGQFVLAACDGDRLYLYRDISGRHSLFYTNPNQNTFAFASQVDPLFHLTRVERRLNRRALHEYLHLLEIAAPNTLFAGIHALEPGQLLTWSADTINLSRPTIDRVPEAPSYEEALVELDSLLQHSVKTRLHDASTPAAFLSGGVDSSLLCALAARVAPTVTAVTVGFDEPRLDETSIAQAVAMHLGVRHNVLRFTYQEFLQALRDFADSAEQPMADPAIAPTVLTFDYCRTHYDVVLDGSGADEAFGAMPPRHVRIAVQYAALLPYRLRQVCVRLLQRTPRLGGYAPIFNFEHPAEMMLRWNGFTRAEIETLCEEPVDFAHTLFYRTFARFPRHAHFERYSALLDAMTCDRLYHAASITGLTVRYPYWDRRVDAFVRSLPLDYRYRPTQPKRLLRGLLARYVPPELWDVPKHGFDFPLQVFLAAEDFYLVRRYLLRADWKRWQVVSAEAVAVYAQRFMAGEHALTFRVWALVVLAAWLESHCWL